MEKIINNLSNIIDNNKYSRDEINEAIDYPLSNTEIEQITNGEVPVMTYKDLYNYGSINELLNNFDSVILLYEKQPDSGHYVLLSSKNNSIEHFDPLGMQIDDEFNYIDDAFRQQYYDQGKYLSNLLLNTPQKLEYNDHHLQKNSAGVSTCGRWCLMKDLLSVLNVDQFNHVFEQLKKKYKKNKDELVTIITKNLFDV